MTCHFAAQDGAAEALEAWKRRAKAWGPRLLEVLRYAERNGEDQGRDRCGFAFR